MTNLDGVFKSRDITLPTKVRLVKAMIFPPKSPSQGHTSQPCFPSAPASHHEDRSRGGNEAGGGGGYTFPEAPEP